MTREFRSHMSENWKSGKFRNDGNPEISGYTEGVVFTNPFLSLRHFFDYIQFYPLKLKVEIVIIRKLSRNQQIHTSRTLA